MDVSVRGITIPVGAVFRVLLRFLDLILLYDFFFLDHTAAAVFAVVFAFLACSSAAGAIVIVLDLCSSDLFFCCLGGTEALAVGDPSKEFNDQNDRDRETDDHDRKEEDDPNDQKQGIF